MGKIEERLKEYVHDVKEYPKCSLRYEVRLPGRGRQKLDKKPMQKTKDIIGQGKTRKEAIWKALRTKKELDH